MGYIDSGKSEGATVHLGGERVGTEGFFIAPTIFTDTKPDMRIVKEEIFGPVGVVIKFEDEDDVIAKANDTMYGLAAAVFSQNINRALQTAHKLRAGTAWVRLPNAMYLLCLILFSSTGQLREHDPHKCSIRWLQAIRYRSRARRVCPRKVSGLSPTSHFIRILT